MKMGALISPWWALSLLQVLLSVSMKAGIIAGSTQPEKSVVERCGETMDCFVPVSCKAGNDPNLIKIIIGDEIINNCKVILKIRAYSKNIYRVMLESRDQSVTEITVTRENTPLFSCKAASEPQYKGQAPDQIIESGGSPLKCEFTVKDSPEVIPDGSTKDLVMSTNGGFKSTGSEFDISYRKLTHFCDPAKATYDPQSTDSNIVTKPIIGLTNLSCSEPSHLETKRLIANEWESEFMTTTSIICEKDEQDSVYKFSIKRGDDESIVQRDEIFNVRCAAPIETTTAEDVDIHSTTYRSTNVPPVNSGSQESPNSASALTLGCIGGGLFILAVMIIGGVVYFVRRRKRGQSMMGKTGRSSETISKMSKSVGSKESKKEGQPALPLPNQVPPTGAPPPPTPTTSTPSPFAPIPGITAAADQPLFDHGIDPSLWTEEHKAMLREAAIRDAKREGEREARDNQSAPDPVDEAIKEAWKVNGTQVNDDRDSRGATGDHTTTFAPDIQNAADVERAQERIARLKAALVTTENTKQSNATTTPTGGRDVNKGKTPDTKPNTTTNVTKDVTVDKVKEDFGKTDNGPKRKLLQPEETQGTTGTTVGTEKK